MKNKYNSDSCHRINSSQQKIKQPSPASLVLQLHVQNEVQVFISILFLGTSWSELFYC